MNENSCDLPEDMDEPCGTHGTVACHAAPNLNHPSQTRHLLSWENGKGSQETDTMTADEAFMGIPPECKTGRYRADGSPMLGGGVTNPHTPRRRAEPARHAPLMLTDTGHMIVVAAIVGVFAIVLLLAWFGVIG